MEHIDEYLSVNTIIDTVKVQHNIRVPNSEMSNDEIGGVMRFLGYGAPDTMWIDGEPTLGRLGIGLMLSLTLYEFPRFYAKYELWQRN